MTDIAATLDTLEREGLKRVCIELAAKVTELEGSIEDSEQLKNVAMGYQNTILELSQKLKDSKFSIKKLEAQISDLRLELAKEQSKPVILSTQRNDTQKEEKLSAGQIWVLARQRGLDSGGSFKQED